MRDSHKTTNMASLTVVEAAPNTYLSPGDLRTICLNEVFAYVSRRVSSREDAEDIAAEVYAAALAARERAGVLEPRAWLLGIARRKIADSLRRSRRRRETLDAHLEAIETTDRPDRQMERSEAVRYLREIVDRLPTDQREALLLQHAEGLSMIEIAQVMRRSTASINGLLQRARASVYRAGKGYFLETTEVLR